MYVLMFDYLFMNNLRMHSTPYVNCDDRHLVFLMLNLNTSCQCPLVSISFCCCCLKVTCIDFHHKWLKFLQMATYSSPLYEAGCGTDGLWNRRCPRSATWPE